MERRVTTGFTDEDMKIESGLRPETYEIISDKIK